MAWRMAQGSARPGQEGYALLSVLAALVIFTLAASTFVALMNIEQRLAGESYRATAALYLAEAGAEKALWNEAQQNSDDEEGNGHPTTFQESLGAGSFTVEEISMQSGLLTVTVRSDVGGTVRRVRRVVRTAPMALAYSLIAGELVLAKDAQTYVVPLPPSRQRGERLGDVAPFKTLWFAAETAFNHFDGRTIATRCPDCVDYAMLGLPYLPPRPALQAYMPDLVLMPEAQVLFGPGRWRVHSVETLQQDAPLVNVRSLRNGVAALPGVAMDDYRALARANLGNAAINRAIGERALDRALREKQDSLYSREQFARVLKMLGEMWQDYQVPADLHLTGVVFVDGPVNILSPLSIEDGALIVDGTLYVADGIRLTVRHTLRASALPGLIASSVRLGRKAVAVADGLLYASGGVEVLKATLDVTGAVIAGHGFSNDGGLVLIRYNDNVLRTVGLDLTRHVLMRPVLWEEVHHP